MTSADLNDLVPAQQEKLEWITPKISLMDAVGTEGAKPNLASEDSIVGPS